MHIFSDLENDTIRVIKADGQQLPKEYKAVVNRNDIQTFDVSIDVEEGDFIERLLSNGKAEKYLVSESQYSEGMPPAIPPFYKFKVSNIKSIPTASSVASTNVYHVSGNNARVLNNSVDHSSNVVNISNDKMFEELRALIEAQLPDTGLIPLVNEMEQARGTSGFAAKYNAFIQSAANHMTLLAPFIPPLTALLIPGQAL
ncbi:hypothetical protein [Pedobacter hiemivivus]|uniref:Uncharacterized protein n=1 Tax=Pedobacter hiemivivus TaxID=2530454 RepID=A0A4R0NHJ8_9SPHI|nr:hypothetical protein [Pedobacter hiemivivus]TCC98802.1 hypothetical protein EZ444_05875 [Pedobacter hiemivivus]